MFQGPPDAEDLKRAPLCLKLCGIVAAALCWLCVAFVQVFPVLAVLDAYKHYSTDSSFPYRCWFSLGFSDSTSAWHGGWMYPVWCWRGPRTFTWTFAALEVCFFVWFHARHSALSAPIQPSKLTDADRDRIFARAVSATADPEAMISGWFQGAPIGEIRRRNLAEWVAWAMYERELECLQPQEDVKVEAMIDQALTRWELDLKPGYNEALRGACMRISLDPLCAR